MTLTTCFVSVANVPFIANFDDSWEFDETVVIEIVLEAQLMAVASEIVELVHVYSIVIVRHDL